MQWGRDSSDRIGSVLATLCERKFNFVNTYAPTNVTDRKGFHDTIHEYFLQTLKSSLGVILIALKVDFTLVNELKESTQFITQLTSGKKTWAPDPVELV